MKHRDGPEHEVMAIHMARKRISDGISKPRHPVKA
jgi:hypothetical protein